MRLGLGFGPWRPNANGVVLTRGPELVTTGIGTWTPAGATPPVIDGSGIHFVAGNTSTNAQYIPAFPTEDGATYEVQGLISGWSSGGVAFRVYGATTAHTGLGPTLSADGPFSFQVTCNGVGTPTNQLRWTGVGTVNLTIVTTSVKKVLP